MIRRALLLACFAFAFAPACASDPEPAPCTTDSECGDGRCLHVHDDQATEFGGYCELANGGPSSATPAPCATNADCPGGIVCAHVHDDATGAELLAFCDVDEHIVCPALSNCGGD